MNKKYIEDFSELFIFLISLASVTYVIKNGVSPEIIIALIGCSEVGHRHSN
jgi:hypothetical protein